MSKVVTAKVTKIATNHLERAAVILQQQGKVVEQVLGWGTHTVYNKPVEGLGLKLKGCVQNVVIKADGSIVVDNHEGWYDERSVTALEDTATAVSFLEEYEQNCLFSCSLDFNEETREANLVVLTD